MFKPYNFQIEAINSIFNYFHKRKLKGKKGGNPLVVAPTGSGKSVIIACFCEVIVNKWPGQKILILSHNMEILSQNKKALEEQLPGKKIATFSAGLNSKDIGDITVAGIQSAYRSAVLFDSFNVVIVDECHTIPGNKNSMYRRFFSEVKRPVIGFTATPFRTGYGYLHLGENRFFDDIVYTIPIKRLQREGYLCQMVAKGSEQKMDTSKIRKKGGDYIIKELSLAFNRMEITRRISINLLQYRFSRKKWLIFAIDIEHCENIAEELNSAGIKADFVHSKMKKKRKKVINDFRKGRFQALVSVAVLTTGFDVPDVDLIGLCRPTASPVLHIQIIGRGMRTDEGKKDCLVLDFAGNLLRNGPIDMPVVKLKGRGDSGEAPLKECPKCWEIVHAAVRICSACGHKFLFQHHLSSSTKYRKVISDEHWHDVDEVKYFHYIGSKGIPMLKVSYFCGLRRFNEYVCFDHGGYATHKAKYWWSRRSKNDIPNTSIQAYEDSDSLITPEKILVDESRTYAIIKEQKFSKEIS